MNLSELGIHIQFDEEDIMKASAIIIGPKDTPYENGILYFIIEFPRNYPFSPPKIGYLSHSRYRIHPNLYVGKSHANFVGKVCLSAINKCLPVPQPAIKTLGFLNLLFGTSLILLGFFEKY